jgi:hypothetical protein
LARLLQIAQNGRGVHSCKKERGVAEICLITGPQKWAHTRKSATRAVLIMMAQAWLRLAYAKNAANVKPDLIALD